MIKITVALLVLFIMVGTLEAPKEVCDADKCVIY